MPHMIGFLAGDADTMATRKAIDHDLRLAVEFPDERRMLLICVMQTGEVTMTWTPTSGGADRVDEMYLVGIVAPLGESTTHHTFEVNPHPTIIPVTRNIHPRPPAKD